ncbi:MAG: DoxX family protein [Acidimicrobiia bacterium]
MLEEHGIGLAVVRIMIGLLFVAHGLDILTAGMARTVAFFEAYKVPMHKVTAPLAGVLQVAGGLAMVLGLGAQIGAWALAALMVGAIWYVHGRCGFPNINIVGQADDGSPQFGMPGFEFNYALIAGLLAVAIGGPGRWAIT